MKLVLLEEAQREFEHQDTWWRTNRDAQDLFVQEFTAILHQISVTPGLGQRYRLSRGKLIRRVLMSKTGCHVYYFHDEEQALIEVHSIWGARRRRGPRL